MKELNFLFNHFTWFGVIWAIVLFDFLMALANSKLTGRFDWSFVPGVLNKLMYYTVYLIGGNIIDYYATATGQNLGLAGFIAIVGIILYAELGSIKEKVNQIIKK